MLGFGRFSLSGSTFFRPQVFDPFLGFSVPTTPTNEGLDGAGTSIVFPTPAGLRAGDLLIAAIYHAATLQATPSGWTLLWDSDADADGIYGENMVESFGVWYRTVVANEPATHTWTLSGTGSSGVSRSGAMAAARGVTLGNFQPDNHKLYFPSVVAQANDATLLGFAGGGADYYQDHSLNDDDLFVMTSDMTIRAKHSAVGPNEGIFPTSRAVIAAAAFGVPAGATGTRSFLYLDPFDTHPSGPDTSGHVGRSGSIVLERA